MPRPQDRLVQRHRNLGLGQTRSWLGLLPGERRCFQTAVSQMIKYPILYHDLRQVADFPLIWKGAFKAAQRTCLAKQKPVMDRHEGKVSYSAFCGSLIYVFEKDGSGWKLTDFSEND